jgi:DNA-binding response OmpR family regulator
MSHPGKLLTRNTILEDVWDQNTNLMTNTVDVHVSQLRKKIKKYTGMSYIKTIPCLGYVFE